jgi:hypothetical protein
MMCHTHGTHGEAERALIYRVDLDLRLGSAGRGLLQESNHEAFKDKMDGFSIDHLGSAIDWRAIRRDS